MLRRPQRSTLCPYATLFRAVDLTPQDCTQVRETVKAKGHGPFLDMAYQCFGDGIDEDAAAVRLFAESGLTFFVSSSFSKSFSLYG